MELNNGDRVSPQMIELIVVDALPEMLEVMDGRITKEDFVTVFNRSLCAMGDRIDDFDKEAWRECFALTNPPFSKEAANVVLGVGVMKIAKPLRVFDGVIQSGSKYSRLANRRDKQMENNQ